MAFQIDVLTDAATTALAFIGLINTVEWVKNLDLGVLVKSAASDWIQDEYGDALLELAQSFNTQGIDVVCTYAAADSYVETVHTDSNGMTLVCFIEKDEWYTITAHIPSEDADVPGENVMSVIIGGENLEYGISIMFDFMNACVDFETED
jgi:hypothetical protein